MKRRAAEEAQRARLENETKEMGAEKDDEEAKLRDEGQQDVKVKLTKEDETKEEAKEEKDGVKTGGNYSSYISQTLLNMYPKVMK